MDYKSILFRNAFISSCPSIFLFLPPLPFCTKYFSLYSRNLSHTDINTENIDAIRTENTNRIPQTNLSQIRTSTHNTIILVLYATYVRYHATRTTGKLH